MIHVQKTEGKRFILAHGFKAWPCCCETAKRQCHGRRLKEAAYLTTTKKQSKSQVEGARDKTYPLKVDPQNLFPPAGFAFL